MQITKRYAAALAILLAAARAVAAPLTQPEIDRLAERTMAQFQVPGMAIGIVKDGKLVFARGYGVRTLGKPEKVDADTVFGIASNTKAFTTAALATLVDSGKLTWDDRVIDHIPEFRLSDAWVTREFTIRDMLTHRSGLGLGAGDLLFVTPTDFTREDILKALRYLKPESSFRSKYAYDNSMYAVAGMLFTPVAGQSWEDYVTAHILQPLHMDGCAATAHRLNADARLASPHVVSEGKLQQIPALDITAVAPAGAIQCNLSGLGKWVATQLGHGTAPDGTRIFSDKRSAEMWTPQTILPVRDDERTHLMHTHFAAYGLGWDLEDFDGYKRVSHNGGLPGMVTHIGLLPELNVGVIVLTNQQMGEVLDVMSLSILESYAGAKHDWLQFAKDRHARREREIREADARNAPASLETSWKPQDPAAYAGVYNDPWRGDATITQSGAQLRLTFSHTQDLSGALTPVGVNLFVVRWDDRTLDADAYVRFRSDFAGRVEGFTMRPVSESTDFSFDFQDLDFSRRATTSAAH
jgi:CubicO group peptidase (beta-lactamase class C family)